MIGERLVREPFFAMGTECSVAVTARVSDLHRARAAVGAGRKEIEACERGLSRFRAASGLLRLNRHHGAWVGVDERLLAALRAALRLRDETNGAYDPTILPALAAAGYDRSFDELEARSLRPLDAWRAGAPIELDPVAGRARLEPGTAVDLGGIGKGFAAQRALNVMHEVWRGLPGALVDLGGDIVVRGYPPEDGPWQVAIADPRTRDTTLGTIALFDGAVATSGRDRRRFGLRGELHHLIDPKTGRPAEQGPLAVTVVGRDATDVEGYATALAVTPVADASALLAARPSLSALLVPLAGEPILVGDFPLLSGRLPMEVIT